MNYGEGLEDHQQQILLPAFYYKKQRTFFRDHNILLVGTCATFGLYHLIRKAGEPGN